MSTFGLAAPAGTPPVVIDRISAALLKGLRDDKYRKNIVDSGSEPGAMSPAEYGAFISDESKRWAKFFERHGEITID
jgi:tripartite-type tricarboxylate transporter receptor subunit TctC